MNSNEPKQMSNDLKGTLVKKSRKYVTKNIGCNILVGG
jgi:hypothetical protein